MDIQTKDGILLRNIPDDTPDEAIKARIEKIRGEPQAAPAVTPPRETNAAQQAAHGANESIVSTIAAIPELVSAGMRKIPGIGESIAPPSGTYENAVRKGVEFIGGPASQNVPEPQTPGQKFAKGAGSGIVDAASMFMPAAAISKGAQVGSKTAAIADALAASAPTQLASGAMGEGASQATGSPIAGMAASVASPLAIKGLARAISPAVNQLTPEAKRLSEMLMFEGVPLTAGQQTGSKPLQIAESVLDNLPFSGAMGNAAKADQRGAFNSAVLSRAGIDAKTATPDVIDAAATKLGQQFENISRQTTVNLDNNFLTDLQAAASKYGTKLPTNTRPVFQSYVDDLMNAGNQISGEIYQQARSDLGRQAKALVTSDPALSNALKGIQGALDDAMERSVPAPLRSQWDQTRGEYANLKTIMKAMSGQGTMQAQGDISPSALYGAARNAVSKDQFTRGAGDLNDLARAGQLFIKDQIPNSGTAQRSMIQNLLTGGGGAGLGVGGMVAGGIPGAVGALATPPLVQALMQSKVGKAYLTNQFAAGMGPKMTPALLAAQLVAQEKPQLMPPQ